jgi:hypothetical protein
MMRRPFERNGPGVTGGVAPERRAAGRAMPRTAVEGQAGGAEVRHAREVYLSDWVGLTVADHDQDVARLDAVAGSEFLDDRLRLLD